MLPVTVLFTSCSCYLPGFVIRGSVLRGHSGTRVDRGPIIFCLAYCSTPPPNLGACNNGDSEGLVGRFFCVSLGSLMQLHSGRGLAMDEFSWEVWAALLPRGLSSIGRLNQAFSHGWQEGKPKKQALSCFLLKEMDTKLLPSWTYTETMMVNTLRGRNILYISALELLALISLFVYLACVLVYPGWEQLEGMTSSQCLPQWGAPLGSP